MAVNRNIADDAVDLTEIPKLLYNKILAYCRKNPADLDNAKQLYITALDKHAENLVTNRSYDEIFGCFEDALELFLDDADILNTLGVTLNRLQKPLKALEYFEKAHQICPKKLKFLENRENVINEWIPRWHFVMLNDIARNETFKQAIAKQICEKSKSVLDIGTGTGILAMYAHDAGAQKIYACESNEIMSEIAEKVFKDNHVDVMLLHNHSTNLTKCDLGNTGVDLIVTEIFDSGVFGEGVLSTLIHAKENLLNEGGKILPERVKVYVVGVDRIGVGEKQESLESTLENSIYLKNTILIPNTDGPYETYCQIGSQMMLQTNAVHAFTVDFNDLDSMKNANDGLLDCTVQLSCSEEGSLEGFLVYFELYLDDENVLRNFDATSSNNATANCWEPVIFSLNHSMDVRKYQILTVTVSCKDGVLKVNHDYNKTSKRVVKIDPDVYSFLTDDQYLYELEFNVGKLMTKNRKNFNSLADFLPFPHIGINLLKEGKIQTLYCFEKIKDFVEEVADWNCISKESIKFVEDLEDLVNCDVKFDLILLQPITNYGSLNDEHLKHYEKLKTNCLSTIGTIFPFKIDLCGKLIHSAWLEHITRVRNAELDRISIEKYINQYSTRHQFEFKNSDSCDLSEVFTLAKVQFNEDYFTKDVVVNLNMSQNSINGILYYYKIFFTCNSIPISTNRKKSFCKQNCFVQDCNVEGKTNVVVRYWQNELAFRCQIVIS